jgi:hypothetical protein
MTGFAVGLTDLPDVSESEGITVFYCAIEGMEEGKSKKAKGKSKAFNP